MSGIFALKGISPLETAPWLLIGWTQNIIGIGRARDSEGKENENENETDRCDDKFLSCWSGVNFTITLLAGFTCLHHKSAKRQSNQAAFCTFGTCSRKSCV